MALDIERSFDRRRLRRRLTFWRVAAIAVAVALVVVLVDRFALVVRGDSVAVLDVASIIFDDPERIGALEEIARDNSIKALVVRIDSPGGTVVGGETLYATLRQVAERKPVVAVLGELATSAGYMTALGADHIVARQGTVTGSIGVLMQVTQITGLLDKLGIDAVSIKSSPLKAQPNPLEEVTPEAREAAQRVIDDMYDMFVDMVVERRSMGRERALDLADGRVYTGRQAVDNGLVDAIGGEREARQWLDEARGVPANLPLVPVEIRRDDGLMAELLDDLFGKALFSERLRLDGLISLWHPELR